MLTVQRRPGDVLHIGEAITLTVVEVRGGVVTLRIECPPEVPVYRGDSGQPAAVPPGSAQ